jgi:hypothetical protein
MTLVEFLAAQLDQHEAEARDWQGSHSPQFPSLTDPAQVLAEVALKRQLLTEHEPKPLVDPDGRERPDWPERVCRVHDHRWMGTPGWAQGDDFEPPEPEYCPLIRALALTYADHPGYDQSWRP